jgi:nitroimidazol reductase NimA-like FMN-containing flavoprotein (pyridoxamine 5'-phosphate oxidase superfamily)
VDQVPVIVELRPDECRALLGQVTIGRVAVSIAGLPAVRTVRFAVVDTNVAFRVAPRSRLARAVTGAVVAFHADHFDDTRGRGWSVLVQGRPEMVFDKDRRAELEALLQWPWSFGMQSDVFFMLPTELMTGQMVGWRESNR